MPAHAVDLQELKGCALLATSDKDGETQAQSLPSN